MFLHYFKNASEPQDQKKSEGEILGRNLKFLYFRFFSGFMIRVPVYKYCTVRSCGTGILAGTATYTDFVNDLRDDKGTFKRDHGTCFCGAVLGTGAASCLFRFYNAVILNEDSFPDLCKFFRLEYQRHYSSRRADIRADCAFIITEAAVEVHPGLHYAGETELTYRRLQYTGGAGTDA